MPRRTRSSGFRLSAWTLAFYLAAVLLAGVLFASTAHADQKPLKTADEAGVQGPVIGIDLGTTYSCMGIMRNGKVDIISNDQGNRITPSWVAFTDKGRLVGDGAKNQYSKNPHRTVFDIVRASVPSRGAS